MTKRMDANVFVGQYPFRGLARADVPETLARMARNGFARAIVSPMEAIFQEDSYAAEASLAGQIAGRPEFIHLKVVNPACPWWPADLDRALHELRVQGIRLCPNYHGYDVTGPTAEPVFAFAVERDLPILVMCKMQDYRMQWLMLTPEVEAPAAKAVVERYPANRLILAGLHFPDMLAMADVVNARDNVLLDTSRLKGPWKTFQKLAGKLDLSRLCFGSLWPINIPECPLQQIVHSSISEETKSGILGGNLARLLRGESPQRSQSTQRNEI